MVYFDVKDEKRTFQIYFEQDDDVGNGWYYFHECQTLRMIAVLGILVCLFSVIMCIISFVDWLQGNNVPGYTTSLIVSLIMGGVTLFSLGIIGEYIGKIYMETKKRPRYIIDTFVWKEDVTQKGEDDV